ncbi:MAG: glycine--tRNA ligase subunit alpha [Candidatus Acidiferrum sp.]
MTVKVKLNTKPTGLTFQDLILKLMQFWGRQACVLQQPYDTEVGAGTMHPETFLRVLGPSPYRVAYVQPSRRPADGRYGENPNRLYKHFQYQVVLKPSPADVQAIYLRSLEAIGINLREHDIRFEEDNWESPTLGAWGIGWQVLLDGLEITQFTYFQQSGGIDLDPISVEITYGLERICAFLQNVESVYDIRWVEDKTYGDIRLAEEQQLSEYSFDRSDAKALRAEFEVHEKEAKELLDGWKKLEGNVGMPTKEGKQQEAKHVATSGDLFADGAFGHTKEAPRSDAAQNVGMPTKERTRYPILAAYDHCLKCSHLFNLMDARGVISTTERAALMARVRTLSCRAASAYLEQSGGPAQRSARPTHEARA